MAVYSDNDFLSKNLKDFVIFPFDINDGVTPVGYDFSIGLAVLLNTKKGSSIKYISEIENSANKNELEIPPNCSAFIVTSEYIWLGKKVLGTLHARGSYAASGLFVNSTTIDPNWEGKLTILVRNTSEKPLSLHIGEKFLTLILHKMLSSTNNKPEGDPSRVAKRYGEIYGDQFSRLLLNYFQDVNNANTLKEFNEQVAKASMPSIFSVAGNNIKSVCLWVIEFIQSKGRSIASFLLIFLAMLALLLSVTLQWYWPFAQTVLNFSQAYDYKVVMFQGSLFVACLSILISFFKKG